MSCTGSGITADLKFCQIDVENVFGFAIFGCINKKKLDTVYLDMLKKTLQGQVVKKMIYNIL